MRLFPVSVLAAAATTAIVGQAVAAPSALVGSYVLVQDDDGTTPRSDAVVSLVLLPDGSAMLSATFAGAQPIIDKGNWSIGTDGKLSMVLPETGKVIFQVKVAEGKEITLPFRVFSDDPGSSRWRRAATVSLRAYAGGKGSPAPTPGPTTILPSTPTVSTPPVTTTTPPPPIEPPPTPGGPRPTRPPQVGSDTAPISSTAPIYVGRYEGTAIGAEVRYRKAGAFTLTAKHTASFWFEINDKGEVKGTGQIVYALDADKLGTAEEANEVESFPELYKPGNPLTLHSSALAGGSVTKDVELKGTYDPKTNALVLSVVTPLGDLVYEYESGGTRNTKPFPAWSPFPPDAPGSLEVSPEGQVAIGLDLSGKARRDKWQEYRFVWNATKK